MHIGMIVRGYPPERVGGAEHQAKKLAQKLAQDGHDVTVFAGSRENSVTDENVHLKIVKVKYRDIRLLRIFLTPLIAFLPRIKKRAARLDVLVCYQVTFAGVVGLWGKILFKIPLVTWLRAESEYTAFLGKYFFTPLLLKSSDLFVVQSEVIKDQVRRSHYYRLLFGRQRLAGIQVIPNGIDPVGAPAIPYRDRKGILYVGRLHRVKGIPYLVQAMQGLEEKLWIVGRGPEQDYLSRISGGINVEFLGELPQEELFRYMRRARCLVLPSLSEALPNVILEAMSAGLPVIATRVGGVPGVAIHGRTGFLVEPRNPAQIKTSLEILLRDPALGEAMSRASLQELEKYSWPAVLKKFEDAILNVGRGRGKWDGPAAPAGSD
jgi:glycosyltransferase involved in cell wall biosynthesis